MIFQVPFSIWTKIYFKTFKSNSTLQAGRNEIDIGYWIQSCRIQLEQLIKNFTKLLTSQINKSDTSKLRHIVSCVNHLRGILMTQIRSFT